MMGGRRLLLIVPFVALAVLASACRGLASPQGWGAPVITPSGGFITTLHKGKIGLTDPSNNATVWEFPPASDKNTKLQGVYGTPAIAGGNVVFGAYDGKVYAVALADGKPAWPAPFDTGASIVGNVTVNSSTAYVGNSDGKVFAVDLGTGKGAAGWAKPFKAGERIWSSPVLDGDTLYVTSMDHKLYALDAATGAVRWSNKDADGAIASTPAIADGRIFFGSFDRHIYAVDPARNGAKVWQSSVADNWFWTHAQVSGTALYAGNLDGYVYAFSTDDGHQLWRQKIGDSIRSAPVLINGVLVVADRHGKVAGVKTDGSGLAWGPVDLQSDTLGDLVTSSDGSKVLAVTESGKLGSRLVQIDPQTGTATDLVKAQ